jgi:WD40 repeat protein/serine/threonine protein kinase
LIGRTLGEFVLRERIGEGGFGAVYRATQPVLDRAAVIKVLHHRLHGVQVTSDRFLREARFASKLDHPYAAHIYAFGAEPDGELWIAMEHVRGTPLDRLLAIQGPIQLERFVPLFERICEVVQTAHEQGIVHRDIKPANVMVLSRAGRLLPKLLDFGIAKALEATEMSTSEPQEPSAPSPPIDSAELASTLNLSSTIPGNGSTELTQRGAVMGSPPYMAPEQWLDAAKADARTDLYALGVLAYEALTGKPPFGGTTLAQIAQAHATQEPPLLANGFPVALSKVLRKAMAKRPEDRFADALTFALAFRQAAGIASETVKLPAIDPTVRSLALASAPQPIAEAVAALDAARNAHQARAAMLQLVRTLARYLGLLALACRSQFGGVELAVGVSERLRVLYQRSLTDREWLALTHELTRSWLERRDAYPLPELIDAFHESETMEDLDALAALRDVEPATDEEATLLLEEALPRVSRVLTGLGFLCDYALVAAVAPGVGEKWMGTRRTQRSTTEIRGKKLPPGVPGLLDRDGVPVLTLAPVFQLATPTPGAPLDLFLFEGRDRRGAKLVALPSVFEHHDDTLWDWFRGQLTDSLDESESQTAEERPPYRGLSPFSVDDGAVFFGRERLVDAFTNRLRIQPLLAVVGRSGAGKSSFVQAGVLPAMTGWRGLVLRPGASPLGTLVARLAESGLPSESLREKLVTDRDALGALLRADAAARGPIILVVDQLEELFTLCDDASERKLFAEALAAAARAPEDPMRVIFTLRDDFLLRTEQFTALRNRISHGLQLLTIPLAEDLLRILVEPARRAGYEFEDTALPAEMIKEVAEQPGALALISFTAAKLWDLRDRHFKQLTRKAYRSLGGVAGALAQHAELILEQMPREERGLTRDAFRHLVTTQNTRAVLERKDLRQLLGGGEHADAVMEKLIAARLLVASENEAGAETIEIVHEALLVTWPRLVEWRREDAAGARLREQLRAAAKQWDERARAKGLLWRGDALAEYARWRATQPGPLTDVEDAFARASVDEAARGRRNRRVALASAFAVLGIMVIGLSFFNTRIAKQGAELRENLQREYEDQGRRLVLAGDPLHALAFLAKGGELGAHGLAHDLLVAQAVRESDGELFEVHHDNFIWRASFSGDGSRLLTASGDHVARIWDTRTHAPVVTMKHGGVINAASFSPDERTVLTGSWDGTAIVWDARTGAQIAKYAHKDKVRCAAYSPDGKLALTGSDDETAAVWDTATGAERLRLRGNGAGMRGCAFSPDGRLAVAGDARGITRVWDAASGALVAELRQEARIRSVEVSPEGTRVLTASDDGTAAVWDLATRVKLHSLVHTAPVWKARWSADGSSILTASTDRTAVVWDAATGSRRLTMAGQAGGLNDATYSPDGQYIATGSDDASVWLWDTTTGHVEAKWRGHQDSVIWVVFDHQGQRVVSAGSDGTAIVWSVRPQERVTWLLRHTAAVQGLAFSPDSRRVVTTGGDRTARLWDVATGHQLASIEGPSGSIAFSPDGRSIATASDGGTIEIRNAETLALEGTLTGIDAPVQEVAWSSDGVSLAAGYVNGEVRCWDPATGKSRFTARGPAGFALYSATFDPTGKRLVTTAEDLTTRIWDLSGHEVLAHRDPDFATSAELDPSGKRMLSCVSRQRVKIWNIDNGQVEVELVGHVGIMTDAAWSPDGALAVTASADGTVRLWDAHTGDALAIYALPCRANSVRFSPNGRTIAIAKGDGTVELHEVPRLAADRDLQRILRCRVPFDVRGDHLQSRDRDRSDCD